MKIYLFLDAITIAGACNKVFRSNYLDAGTLGVIPVNGYRFMDNQSHIGVRWLMWLELTDEIGIQHAARDPDMSVGKFKVDGYHAPTRTIYEFQGCFFYGCEDLLPIQYTR